MLNILAPMDSSVLSKEAVPVLLRLAKEASVHVKLLVVVPHDSGTGVGTSNMMMSQGTGRGGEWPVVSQTHIAQPPEPRWRENPDQASQRVTSESAEFLIPITHDLGEAGLEVEEEIVVDRDAAHAIIESARKASSDLIVMTTHGLGGLTEVIQGRVAAAVIRSGVAPVVLVNPKKG